MPMPARNRGLPSYAPVEVEAYQQKPSPRKPVLAPPGLVPPALSMPSSFHDARGGLGRSGVPTLMPGQSKSAGQSGTYPSQPMPTQSPALQQVPQSEFVGPLGRHPLNQQYAPQLRASNFSMDSMNSKWDQREAARDSLHQQNMRVIKGTPILPVSAVSDMVAANQQQVGRNWMSANDKRMISAPQQQGIPLNARGDGSFSPSSTPINAGVGTSDGGLRYVENNRGGRRRFYEGRGGRSIDTVDQTTGVVTPGKELGYQNSAGTQTVIGRTANGGLSFTGIGPAYQSTPEELQKQSEAKSRRQESKDSLIVSRARRNGLGAGTPVVGAAMDRIDARQRLKSPTTDPMQAKLQEAIMAAHAEHAATMKPLDRIAYLQSLMKQSPQNRITQPVAMANASSGRMPIMALVDELQAAKRQGLLKRDSK